MFGKGKITFAKIKMPIGPPSDNEKTEKDIINEEIQESGFGKFGNKEKSEPANIGNNFYITFYNK